MKKLITLSIGLLCLQLSAQNVELTIEPNGIKVQNDYLFFKFRLQNNSDSVLAFCNAGSMVDVATSEKQIDFDMLSNIDFGTMSQNHFDMLLPTHTGANSSGLSCFIYDENGRFRPRTFIGIMDYYFMVQTYADSINSIYHGKYIILSPGRFVEYERRLDISKRDMGEKLEKGTYKFRLKYGFFSDYYREEYLIAKETDESLQNTVLFEGEIWSDFYLFEYP